MPTPSSRFRRRSPPAAPLEDDDLLSEILLRLPPARLPRVQALAQPRLPRRRFRAHHRRRGPPLLGFLDDHHRNAFQPALDAPDRLPHGLFSLRLDDGYTTLGWRHGFALFFFPIPLQVHVWDPVAGVQRLLPVPPEFHLDLVVDNGAVLRGATGDAGDRPRFRLKKHPSV